MNKFNLKQTEKIEKEIEIPIPYFRKTKSKYTSWISYIGLLNESTCIHFSLIPDYTNITHSTPANMSKQIMEASKEGEEISEEQFLLAYEETLRSISLTPKINDDLPSELFQQ